VVEDLILICDRAYTRADILEMVKKCAACWFLVPKKQITDIEISAGEEDSEHT
jgi:hypothetical protein